MISKKNLRAQPIIFQYFDSFFFEMPGTWTTSQNRYKKKNGFLCWGIFHEFSMEAAGAAQKMTKSEEPGNQETSHKCGPGFIKMGFW